MSSVHYFPRYSQRENAVTNNVLLLLSRLYEYRPDLLQAAIGELIENDSIQVGPTIRQQQRIKKGTIPDGEIYQPSFRLIVETKAGSPWLAEQLIGHLNAFKNEDTQVLLLLSEEPAPFHVIDAVKAKIKTFQSPSGIQISVASITFDGLIRSIREVIDDRDFEMNDILEDFEAYASEEGGGVPSPFKRTWCDNVAGEFGKIRRRHKMLRTPWVGLESVWGLWRAICDQPTCLKR